MASDGRIEIEIVLDNGKVVKGFTKIESLAKRSGKKSGDAFATEFADKSQTGLGKLDVAFGVFAAQAVSRFVSGLKQAVSEGVTAFRDFERSVAEVNTILPQTAQLTGLAASKFIELSNSFGSAPTSQAKAFYQIISSGAAEGAEATELLVNANKLAIGGISDLGPVVNVLTDVLNVYGKQNISSAKAGDILFKTVERGKTTIGELSSSLGQVLPLASKVGVNLETVGAALATLTKQGQSTGENITGLRSLFTALLKKGGDVEKQFGTKIAKAFNITALRTKGLSRFLQDLSDATGGSEETLVKLLGRVEAAQTVFKLTGNGARIFAGDLDALAEATGSQERAFGKLAETTDFQIRRLEQRFANLKLGIGEVVAKTSLPLFNSLLDELEGDANKASVALEPFIKLFESDAQTNIKKTTAELELFGIKLGDVTDKALFFIKSFGKTALLNLVPGLGALANPLRNVADGIALATGNTKELGAATAENLDTTPWIETQNSIAAVNAELMILNELKPGQEFVNDIVASQVTLGEAVDQIGDSFLGLSDKTATTLDRQKAALESFSKFTARVGQNIRKGLASGIAGGFAAFGKALAEGENAFDAFAKSFLATLGQMMIQQGAAFILQGLGFSVIPGLQASGGALIAAGAGLAALGGALTAIGGGGGSAGLAGSGGGEPVESGFLTSPEDEEREAPGTEVVVNISGDVLDSEETGIRIVDIINDAFDKSGVTVRTA